MIWLSIATTAMSARRASTRLIEEFRAAQQRRLVKRGIALWNRAEAAQQAMTYVEPPPPEKVH